MKHLYIFSIFLFVSNFAQEKRILTPAERNFLLDLIHKTDANGLKKILVEYKINNLDQEFALAAEQTFLAYLPHTSSRPSLLCPAGRILTMVYQRCPAHACNAQMSFPFQIVKLSKKRC